MSDALNFRMIAEMPNTKHPQEQEQKEENDPSAKYLKVISGKITKI